MTAVFPSTAVGRLPSVRVRRDLEIEAISFHGRRYWNVKDPLRLCYFQLSEEEAFLMRHVDGEHTLEELQRMFAERFPPRRIGLDQLQAFLGMLHRAGLTTARVAGQGVTLLERHQQAERQRRWQSLANLLAIRFRGMDPEPFLRWLYPKVRWAFSTPMLAAAWALIAAAVLLVLTQFPTFTSRLPAFQAFFTPANAILLAGVLAACKVLHELAHALTCKHFGGQCRELGMMLLVFTPCLYCNVSDAWMLRDKWQRIAISAAGMQVELLLAAIATFLWWFSQPGLFNSICLNVMVICSVSTLLFNGNPLLRYDGYFILSDLVEVPNLRQQAQAVWKDWALQWFRGQPTQVSAVFSRPARIGLAVYAAASVLYRWLLAVVIVCVLYQALRPYRLEVLAQLLGVLVVVGMVFAPVVRMSAWLRDPTTHRKIQRPKLAVTLLASVTLLALLLALPVQRHVVAPVVIEPARAARLYAPRAGRLEAQPRVGQAVSLGDELALIVDQHLDRELIRLQGERDLQRLYVEQLQLLQVRDTGADSEAAGSRLLTAQDSLESAERQLQQRRADQARMRVTAPRSGVVLPPRAAREADESDELPAWSGTPLDPDNLGCHVEAGTLLCLIGEPREVQGMIVIKQADVQRVASGQRVEILLDEFRRVLEGHIADIAEVDVETLPPELAAKRLLPHDPRDQASQPLDVYYLARVTLPELSPPLPMWSSGRARITVAPRSLGRALYDAIRRTFRLSR